MKYTIFSHDVAHIIVRKCGTLRTYDARKFISFTRSSFHFISFYLDISIAMRICEKWFQAWNGNDSFIFHIQSSPCLYVNVAFYCNDFALVEVKSMCFMNFGRLDKISFAFQIFMILICVICVTNCKYEIN